MIDPQEWRTYRPSNGTEGMIFVNQWCCRCRNDPGQGIGCNQIIGASLMNNVDSPLYPKEMQCRLVDGVLSTRCTSFNVVPKIIERYGAVKSAALGTTRLNYTCNIPGRGYWFHTCAADLDTARKRRDADLVEKGIDPSTVT